MPSDRPYRRALPFKTAREVIEQGAGMLYDPHVANVFLNIPEETWEAVRSETASIQSFGLATASDIQAPRGLGIFPTKHPELANPLAPLSLLRLSHPNLSVAELFLRTPPQPS